uniref:Uncharacterized protein n=1 Tax=Arundo donax TaxID=35708 RepID=A0A0A9HAT5_ARUDO
MKLGAQIDCFFAQQAVCDEAWGSMIVSLLDKLCVTTAKTSLIESLLPWLLRLFTTSESLLHGCFTCFLYFPPWFCVLSERSET